MTRFGAVRTRGGGGSGIVETACSLASQAAGTRPGSLAVASSHSCLDTEPFVAVGVGLGDDLLDALEGHVRIILRERLEDFLGGQLAVAVGVHVIEGRRCGQGLAHELEEAGEAQVAALDQLQERGRRRRGALDAVLLDLADVEALLDLTALHRVLADLHLCASRPVTSGSPRTDLRTAFYG